MPDSMVLKLSFINLSLWVITSCALIDSPDKGQSVSTDSVARVVPAEKIQPRPYFIKDTQVHEVKSSLTGIKYELFIRLPRNYDKSIAYPVLVLTDSDYSFPLVSSLSRRLDLDPFILVGISYSLGDKPTTSRTRDYTPTYSPNEVNGHSKEARLASGHADDFTAFIRDDVFPFITIRFKIDLEKRVYAGFSFGGLLGAYILVTDPTIFDYYLAGSPSLWYHGKSIYDFEEVYAAQHDDLAAQLFLCIGSLEEHQRNKMVSDMHAFEKRLQSRQYPSLTIKSMTLAGEDHLTSYPGFITQGLLWIFGNS